MKTPFQLIVLLICLCLVCISCKKEYQNIAGNTSGLFCVDASLVKNRETQKIIITRSVSSTNDDIPYVKGCQVYVEDENGNKRYFTETSSQGIYTADIEDDYLVINRQYRLTIETTGGETYQSDYEKLYDCPPVDSIYFEYSTKYSYSLEKIVDGIQFYVDVKAGGDYSEYYRWLFNETWEYRIPYYYKGYWDSDTLLISDVKDLRTCYMNMDYIFLCSSSLADLTSTYKNKIALNFVNTNSVKLRYRYSMLLKQLSLTPEAYAYWNQKKIELQESDGMYTTQPAQNTTNIKNIDNGDETILGYFWVGKKTEKRILINIPLNNKDNYTCVLDTIELSYEIYDQTSVYYDTSGILIDSIPPGYNPDNLFYSDKALV